MARNPWGRLSHALRGTFHSRTARVNLVVFSVLLAVAVLVMHLTTPMSHWADWIVPGDGAVYSYVMAWGAYAIFHCPWRYYDIPLFYPQHFMLPGTDGLELQSLLTSPVWYATKNPVLVHNIGTFLSHLFTLLAGFYAVRVVLRVPRAWGVLLAVFFGITSDRFWHSFGHMNLIWTGILALTFAFTWAALEYRRRAHVVLLGVAFGLSVYFSVYMFVLSVLSIAAAIIIWMLSRLSLPRTRQIAGLGTAAIIAVLIASPKILAYKTASARSTQNRASLLQASYYSATVQGYAQPAYRPRRLVSFWYKILYEPKEYKRTDEDQQFFGYLLALLVMAESIRLACRVATRRFDRLDRLSAAALLACICFVLASFGPNFRLPLGRGLSFSPYILLYESFLRFTGFYRAPARLAFLVEWIAVLPVGVLLMRAAALSRLQRCAYATAGICLVVFEHAPSENMFQMPWERLSIFDKMDELDPTGKEAFVALDPELGVPYTTLSNTGHWRPAVNGWLGSPLGKKFDQVAGEFENFPNSQTLQWLAANKVKWVLAVHPAEKARIAREPRLEVVDSAQGIDLVKLKDPAAIMSAYEAETKGWRTELSAKRAATPQSQTWPGDPFLILSGGDQIRKTPGAVAIHTLENGMASILFNTQTALPTGVWDEITIKYRLAEPSPHQVKLYWQTAADPMSEKRTAEAEITQPADSSGLLTATLKPGANPLWLTDKALTKLRFDFHSFANLRPADIEVVSVTLSRKGDTPSEVPAP